MTLGNLSDNQKYAAILAVVIVIFLIYWFMMRDSSLPSVSHLSISFYGTPIPYVVTSSAMRQDGSWGINEVLGANGNYQRVLLPDASNRFNKVKVPSWLYKYLSVSDLKAQLPLSRYNLPKFAAFLQSAADKGALYFDQNLQSVYVNQKANPVVLNGLNEGTYLNM